MHFTSRINCPLALYPESPLRRPILALNLIFQGYSSSDDPAGYWISQQIRISLLLYHINSFLPELAQLHTKGYCYYSPASRQILLSQNVIFLVNEPKPEEYEDLNQPLPLEGKMGQSPGKQASRQVLISLFLKRTYLCRPKKHHPHSLIAISARTTQLGSVHQLAYRLNQLPITRNCTLLVLQQQQLPSLGRKMSSSPRHCRKQ
jgi:hypothetical protein